MTDLLKIQWKPISGRRSCFLDDQTALSSQMQNVKDQLSFLQSVVAFTSLTEVSQLVSGNRV